MEQNRMLQLNLHTAKPRATNTLTGRIKFIWNLCNLMHKFLNWGGITNCMLQNKKKSSQRGFQPGPESEAQPEPAGWSRMDPFLGWSPRSWAGTGGQGKRKNDGWCRGYGKWPQNPRAGLENAGETGPDWMQRLRAAPSTGTRCPAGPGIPSTPGKVRHAWHWFFIKISPLSE